MTNTLQKIMHNGDEYDLPTWFTPDNAGSTDDVLTKTANGYEWSAPSGGDVVVSSDADNELSAWAGLWVGDENNLPAQPDSNTLYFAY